jgi:hypothetical protein
MFELGDPVEVFIRPGNLILGFFFGEPSLKSVVGAVVIISGAAGEYQS